MIKRILAAAALVAAVAAHAQTTVEGVNFDHRIRLAGQDLVLNGVGVRGVAWIKGYAAALYLPQKASTPENATTAQGAKRIELHMLLDAPAKEFVKAIEVGIPRNAPPEQRPALAERQAAFERNVAALGSVKKGDVVDLDFVPGRGLVMALNGTPRGEPIAGDDFYAAVMRIFIGDLPVDKKLKRGLLGQAAG